MRACACVYRCVCADVCVPDEALSVLLYNYPLLRQSLSLRLLFFFLDRPEPADPSDPLVPVP